MGFLEDSVFRDDIENFPVAKVWEVREISKLNSTNFSHFDNAKVSKIVDWIEFLSLSRFVHCKDSFKMIEKERKLLLMTILKFVA